MYQTLYRKYRPKNFNDIFGQDVVTKTLKNAIINGRIGHANMFIGPRGTGKTSIAKIFARAVNCTDSSEGDLCGKCSACVISSDPECLDIIEIDAASNNGVDEIRELRDKVALVPSSLKYKVYIIDEVHMLTIQAFNALLKTLEEPPEHVIFILATTDPQKIPETIISRCQCFNFNRISDDNIVSNLKRICEKENVSYDEFVLNEIAIASDGGMRDSISILDKLISYSQKDITIDDFYKINNIISKELRIKFITSVINGDFKYIINELEKWNASGISIVQTLIKMLDDVKNIIVDYYINGNDILVEMIDKYESFAVFLNDNLEKMKKSNNQKIFVEISLLKYMKLSDSNIMCKEKNISREIKNDNISREIKSDNISRKDLFDECPQKIESSSASLTDNTLPSNIKDINEVRINNVLAEADKNELISDKNKYLKLNDFVFDQKIGYLVCILLDGNIVASSSKYILISYEYDSILDDVYSKLDKISTILGNTTGINKKIAVITNTDWSITKNDYINKIKNGEKFEVLDEPELKYNNNIGDSQIDSNNVIINNITNAFGDIVVVE